MLAANRIAVAVRQKLVWVFDRHGRLFNSGI
jgi:hypothetical protein